MVAPSLEAMRQIKRYPWWPLIATLPAVVSPSSQAFEASDLLAYKSGPITLRTHVGVAEVYNDNVYYEPPENAKSDFSTVIDPSLTLSLGRETTVNPWLDFFEQEGNFVSLKGGANFYSYVEQTELDTIDPSVSLKGRWKGNHLSVKGEDSISMVSAPLGYGYVGSLTHEKVTHTTFNNNYLVDYSLSEKTRAYMGGAFDAYYYEQGTPLYDQNTSKGTLGFGYQALTKLSFFGEAFYGQTALDPNTSTMSKPAYSRFFGGYVGAQRSLTERFTGMVKVGYETREFSDGTPVPAEPVVEALLTYRFREKASFTFNYSRQNIVSVESSSVSYLQNIVGLQYHQGLGTAGKMGVNAGVSMTLADYGNTGYYAGRSDIFYRANVDFYYLIRAWLTARLGYQFDTYGTNDEGKSLGYYDSNVSRVTIGLSVGY
jgi:hypothetical protein